MKDWSPLSIRHFRPASAFALYWPHLIFVFSFVGWYKPERLLAAPIHRKYPWSCCQGWLSHLRLLIPSISVSRLLCLRENNQDKSWKKRVTWDGIVLLHLFANQPFYFVMIFGPNDYIKKNNSIAEKFSAFPISRKSTEWPFFSLRASWLSW